METQKFLVSITFTDSVSNRGNLQEIVQNIVDALVDQVNGRSLAPEDSDALTVAFNVSSVDVPQVQASKVIFNP